MDADEMAWQPTPERLTEALRRDGDLGEGRVTEVSVESARDTLLSTVSHVYRGIARARQG